MSSALPNLPAPVAATLDRWHAMVASGDLSDVADLLREDVTFASPAVWTPYPGRVATAHILATAIGVLEDFAYHRSFVTDDGHDVVLEFSARSGDLQLAGIDMIAFDAAGLISRFEVMIRPLKALAALAEKMGANLDQTLLSKAAAR